MLRRLGWIIAALTLALILASVVHSTNLTVELATLFLCVLAIARPDDALLVVIAFVGLGNILRVFAGISTLRVEEITVVAALLGWCTRSAFGRSDSWRASSDINALPVVLFGLTVACSAAVWMRVDQVRTEYLASHLGDLWRWLTVTYFVDSARFADVVSTTALLESLALYLAVATMCGRDRTFFERALRMLVVGGAAVGALSIVRAAQIALSNPNAFATLRATGAGLRISPQISDYIAAAAYFGLCWTTAMGLALQRSRRRVFMVLAALLLLSGLFLTGSRTAIGAAVGGIAVLAYLARQRENLVPKRVAIGIGVIALTTFAIAYPKFNGRDLAGTAARASLKARVGILQASAGVFETHPVFGVGLDRFFLYVDRFMPPEATWIGRKNPHNDFIRVATEFGLTGLALFVWILTGCAKRIRQGWSARGNAPFAGLVGGLTAFVITMFTSNPLMEHAVAYAFWIAVGLATGEATAPGPEARESEAAARPRTLGRNVLIALAGVLLIASVPLRAMREVSTLNLAGVTYGLYGWMVSTDGTPSRLSGAQATLFVAADARVVEVPLRGTLPTGGLQTVHASVDGHVTKELTLGREWQRLRLELIPANAAHARRIDLSVTPTWTPAVADASSNDHRTLGLEVGRPVVTRGTPGGR
jgi:O-antigen ligase